MREAVIVAMGRSPIGKAPKGSLKNTRPEDLGAQVVKGIFAKMPGFDTAKIDDFIVGCAIPEAEQGLNVARIIGLKAGLPIDVPGQTVNRFCSSGLQTIAAAANAIMVGQADVILAGGVESMSTIPMGGNIILPDPDLIAEYPQAYIAMGHTAERVAEQFGVSREQQDAFAYESHIKALKAIENGHFKEEIIPITALKHKEDAEGKMGIGRFTFEMDEGPRKDVSVSKLGGLKPVFKYKGTVTAGNSSQTSDGAAFVLIMSSEKAKELAMEPIARFVSFAVAGVDPGIMGIGPVKAIPKALKLAGMTQKDIDIIELNEAFAAQSIACINKLGLNKEIVNVNGGAIALGHPLGCSGAYLTIKMLMEMRRRQSRYGLVSMCIGGGMGAAGIFERL